MPPRRRAAAACRAGPAYSGGRLFRRDRLLLRGGAAARRQPAAHAARPLQRAAPPALTPAARSRAPADALVAEAQRDSRIVAVHAAMAGGTGLYRFEKHFPERCYDVGIAEQHAVTFAAGLACEGLAPFCTIYSTFLQRGYDQVVHDVSLQKLPGERRAEPSRARPVLCWQRRCAAPAQPRPASRALP